MLFREYLQIVVHCTDMSITKDVYDQMPGDLQRHFEIQPEKK